MDQTVVAQCVINNPYCTPRPCANCKRVFCAHEHPKLRAFGYYGQYCTEECWDAKYQQMVALGQERFNASRVVLVVEQDYCYLILNKHRVFNKHKREVEPKPGYGFKILHESAESPADKLNLDYCHYPGFSMQDHPVTYAMYPRLTVAIVVHDEYGGSMLTIVGFRFLDGEIDTFGVGGHIEVIDLRKARED